MKTNKRLPIGIQTFEKIINNKITHILRDNGEELNLICKNDDHEAWFAELIKKACIKYNEKVIILIDEYDKPILDNITNQEFAFKTRHILKIFML